MMMIKIHSKIKKKENEIRHITKWAITFLVLLSYDNPLKWSARSIWLDEEDAFGIGWWVSHKNTT